MKNPKKLFREKIPLNQIASLEVCSEENVKRFGASVGLGLVGGALLGPLGLLAGALSGGTGKDVTFICKLKDGRQFLATAESKIYREMSVALFEADPSKANTIR